jgi:hypothetical protein
VVKRRGGAPNDEILRQARARKAKQDYEPRWQRPEGFSVDKLIIQLLLNPSRGNEGADCRNALRINSGVFFTG